MNSLIYNQGQVNSANSSSEMFSIYHNLKLWILFFQKMNRMKKINQRKKVKITSLKRARKRFPQLQCVPRKMFVNRGIYIIVYIV